MRASTVGGEGAVLKYVVELNGIQHAVSLTAAGVGYDESDAVDAELLDVRGNPEPIVRIGTHRYQLVVETREGKGRYTLWIDGYRFEVEALDERTRAIRELSKASAAPTGPAPIKAPMPGLIVRINVRPGDVVEAGQGVVVMEAMKMENELRAISGGTVKSVEVVPGAAVEKGTILVALE